MNHVTLIWDVATRQLVGRYNDHTHFVQGVAWDPFGGLLATQSSDRSVRLYADKVGTAAEKHTPTFPLLKNTPNVFALRPFSPDTSCAHIWRMHTLARRLFLKVLFDVVRLLILIHE